LTKTGRRPAPASRHQLPTAGVLTPMVTPLTPAGAPDLASLERLIDHLVAGGVAGVLVHGSAGEAGFLDDDAAALVVERTVAHAAGRIHVLAGVAALGTTAAATQARRWADLGAGSVLVTAPAGFEPSRDEIAAHFRTVARACGIPVVAYNVPSRVPVYLPPDVLAALAAGGVIRGVKDSSGDLQRGRVLCELTAGIADFVRYTGVEESIDSWLLAGYHASIPGLSNAFTGLHPELTRHAAAGDWQRAHRVQSRIVSLLDLYSYSLAGGSFSASFFGVVKEALVQQGVIAHSTISAPMTQPDDGLRVHVARILERVTG
jgi:4-hydroxy-tetrahydrodipicolinate synthase